jgi:hypothetical protein
MPRFWTSPTSSVVTIQGPTGPKVSQPLPLSQVPSALDLEGALRDVVDQDIAGDVVEGLFSGNVASARADDDA